MPILDQATFNATERQAYFGENNLSHAAGYSNYELEFQFQGGAHYKQRLEDFVTSENITGAIDILELGGARGHRAVHALTTWSVIKSWEIIDLYNSPFKNTHAKLTYTIGDARILLNDSKTYKTNGKDVIMSFRFLECIPEADLPNLISNMNRISKQKQYHIVSTGENSTFYSARDLAWWSTQGFESGTAFITSRDFQHGNFENIVRVA